VSNKKLNLQLSVNAACTFVHLVTSSASVKSFKSIPVYTFGEQFSLVVTCWISFLAPVNRVILWQSLSYLT